MALKAEASGGCWASKESAVERAAATSVRRTVLIEWQGYSVWELLTVSAHSESRPSNSQVAFVSLGKSANRPARDPSGRRIAGDGGGEDTVLI